MKKLQQFNIYAFNFERLKNNNFRIETTPFEAELDEELIALADNECLRAIRRITGHQYDEGGEQKINQLFVARKKLTKQPNSEENRRRIAGINNEIRDLLFMPEYVCVIFPRGIKKKDFEYVNKNGFYINDIKYKWIICGASHQRTNRAFYCCEKIYDKLYETLNCGAKAVPILLPKYNAYLALSTSASSSVSSPRVCVIPDCEIKMTKRVDWVEPVEDDCDVSRVDKELDFNLFDGMGIISPKFAKKWAAELELDYLPSCWGIRSAFIKGMVCVIDFHEFANEVAKKSTITDVYGQEYDIDNIDIIITKSQFKLWNAYDKWSDYLDNQEKYGIGWGVTKISPKQDVNWVTANYQYLQVLNMSNEDVETLCQETIEWIKNVSGDGNYIFKVLYSLGKMVKRFEGFELWERLQDSTCKALIIEPELAQDGYLSEKNISSLQKRIKQTFLGRIIIRGNYQIRISDPYALMEWAFGMEVKGLLKEGEDYMEYWNKIGATEVVAMRSPLTWRSEAHILKLRNTEEMRHWYQYLYSGIVYNVWGCDCMLEADGDFDLDASCTTNNKVFLSGAIK